MTTPQLQPHQLLVIEEHKDMAERLARLSAFIRSNQFQSVDSTEQTFMTAQWVYLTDYVRVLKQRIDLHAAIAASKDQL